MNSIERTDVARQAGSDWVESIQRLPKKIAYEPTVYPKKALLFPADIRNEAEIRLIKLPCLLEIDSQRMVPVCRSWIGKHNLVAFTWNQNVVRNRPTRRASIIYTVEDSNYHRWNNVNIESLIEKNDGYHYPIGWSGPVIAFARAGQGLFSPIVEDITEHDFRDIFNFFWSFNNMGDSLYDPKVDKYLRRGPRLDLNLHCDDERHQEHPEEFACYAPGNRN
ncbi:MAG: hypothetical protein MMC33_005144 [Icmadophila ericetorum]|nr:hypothetical protein [Icmadophila ericetorum]